MAKKYTSGAIKHPGAVKRAGKAPIDYARSKVKSPGKTGQRSRLAMMSRGFGAKR